MVCAAALLLSIAGVCAEDNSTMDIDENEDLLLAECDTDLIEEEGKTASAEWYVDASSSTDGDGSAGNPFNNLKSCLNKSGDGDTIYIAPGIYNGSGRNVNLTIDKAVNLVSSGTGDVIFDGEGNCRIFNVTALSLNITGLTFTHGNSGGYGGAIYFANGLKDSIINANFIENNAQFGGAIYFDGDISNNIFNGSFNRNEVLSNGGAMYIVGIATNNSFIGNYCENKGKGYYGGAIYFTNHTSYNKFIGNFSNNVIVEGSGAGIVFNWDVNCSVFSANFSNNYVTEFPSAAFEVYGNFYNNTVGGYFENNRESAILLNFNSINSTFNAVFVNNSARHGGIFTIESSINSYFNCTFINNRGENGVALNFAYSIINTTIDGIFINNTATNNGGAIAVYNDFPTMSYPIENFTIRGVFINNTAANYGGAIYIQSGSGPLFNASVFEGNTAKNGGAIYLNASDVCIDSCVFANNTASVGGAIYAIKNMEVEKSNFTDNFAKRSGGAIFLVDEGNVSGSNFIANTASFYGGGIYFTANGIVADSNFTDNIARRDGGAIFLYADGTISGSSFINNTAWNDGGAIYANGQGNIADSDFMQNEATNNGGAILFNEEGIVKGCCFKENLANISGGAICSQNLLDVDQSNFTQNHAFYGGALSASGDGIIINSNFTNNNASSGGALRVNGNINVSNNVFMGNTADDGTNDVDLIDNATFRYIVVLNVTKSTNVKYGEAVKITVKLTCEEKGMKSGSVYVIIKNKRYFADVADGTATIQITGLNAGTYDVDVVYDGGINYTSPSASAKFTVSKLDSQIGAKNKAYVINYGGKYSITLRDAKGNVLKGKKVTFTLNGKAVGSATANAKGIAAIKLTAKILKAVKAGKRKLVIKFAGDNNYNAISKTVKISINKEKTKIKAKKKTFKKAKKVKKYKIQLKDSKGKAIRKAKVILKIKKKTFKAKTNSKGKATFKIKKLTKKGRYSAKIMFKGDKYYKKVAKKVKIRIK